ncbi:MAG: class I SAM-dependent methyltransferase [Bacteroidia bacterium]|nr:class I SAM-dependent methyltransferase [Bacteroidia bacterium]
MSGARRVFEYLKYYLRADTLYGIHSPAVYKLLNACFEDAKHYYETSRLVHHREEYLLNNTIIEVMDSGAGSKYSSSQQRSISSIAKHSSSDLTKCKMLFNLSKYFEAKYTLELGTNLGLGTAHIHAGNKSAELHTVEGDPTLSTLAQRLFNIMNYQAIHCHQDEFSTYIDHNQDYIKKVDFVFIDGNHKYQATLDYYSAILNNPVKKKLVIIDDIYWSEEMTAAWKEIKQSISYGATIDLFTLGLVLLDPQLVHPESYRVMRFKYKPWKMGLGGWF